MTSYTACGEAGYGWAQFDVEGELTSIGVRVEPNSLAVYLTSFVPYHTRRAVWTGAEAVLMGRAVCSGQMHPAILADWCDENEPFRCDRDFDPAKWLRKAMLVIDTSELPF